MSATRTCGKCGAAIDPLAPDNLCLNCLLDSAVLSESEANLPATLKGGDAPSAQASTAPAIRPLASFGDYELLEEIARGGMGVVYKARQVRLNRLVALKMILSGQFASKQEVLRFRVEAEAAANLNHPNIVGIYETGELNGQHHFSMEYVAGPNLSQLVGAKPLTASQAARYTLAIARAIHYAHTQNTLHRDRKPSNVLLGADDQPRVTDFGLTRRMRGEFGITVTGQVLGSPNYMPPEQAGGKRGQTGPFSDVYSIGAILYYLLTARAPFQSATIEDTLLQVLNKEPVSPRLLNNSVPRDLETICVKCLQKEPERRYQTADELADELDRFLRDEPIEARPVHPTEKAWRWCRRKPVLASLSAAVMALVVTLAFGSTIAALRIGAARNAARQSLYAADMKQVQQAWESGDTRLATILLEAQRPPDGQAGLRGFEWRYWWKVCQGEQFVTFRGHTGAVTSVAFSPDGTTVASASRDGTVRLWDLKNQREITSLKINPSGLAGVAISPDGRVLATGGTESAEAITLWDATTHKEIATIRSSGAFTLAAAFSSDGRFLSTAEGWGNGTTLNTIKVWDATTRQIVAAFRNCQSVPCTTAFSPDGGILAAAGELGFFKLWDLSTQNEIITPPLENLLTIASIAFSPDGKIVAIPQSRSVRLLDLTTNGVVRSLLTAKADQTLSVAFSPDGRVLALGNSSGGIELWEVTTQRRLHALQGHTEPVSSIAFAPDGKTLISASHDKTVRLWSLSARNEDDALHGHSNAVSCVALSPDGQMVASGSLDSTIRLWDAATMREISALTGHGYRLRSVAFSPDGKLLVSASGESKEEGSPFLELGDVKLWDVGTRRELATFEGLTNAVRSVAFSPDGRTIALAAPYAAELWDVSSRRELAMLSGPGTGDRITSVAFSPDGQTLAVGSRARRIEIWNVASRKEMATLIGLGGGVECLAFSPDGKFLASGSQDLMVSIWDIRTRKRVAALPGHKVFTVSSVAFAPDGKTLASSGWDGAVKLWSTSSHRELATLSLHSDKILALAFSRDGRLLVSGIGDGSIKRWCAPNFVETDLAPTQINE